ncbi:MAG: class IV adenylate cyclase [Anaerolineales bacterium]|nr:class IV adenylate cyclase [Anaerolineales bacterium]
MNLIELEAKFWLPHLLDVRQRLIELGAALRSPRTLERNLRFDTLDHSLSAKDQVLRLRQAHQAFLTYKRPASSFEEREEFEFEIGDFEMAQRVLEALGFEVVHRYEKYREIFRLNDCLVMLDEVPYGCFTEIEGPDLESIQSTGTKLGLYWEQRVQRTYLDMFKELREQLPNKPPDATFAAFDGIHKIDVRMLKLPRGDQPPQQEGNTG